MHTDQPTPSDMHLTTYVAQLRARLRQSPATYHAIAARSGGVLSHSWVAKFASGHRNNPSINSLLALDAALQAEQPIASPDADLRTQEP